MEQFQEDEELKKILNDFSDQLIKKGYKTHFLSALNKEGGYQDCIEHNNDIQQLEDIYAGISIVYQSESQSLENLQKNPFFMFGQAILNGTDFDGSKFKDWDKK